MNSFDYQCLFLCLLFISFILFIIAIFFSAYFILYLIAKKYDPPSMKKSFNYNSFDQNKFKINSILERAVQRLYYDGFSQSGVNMNGVQSIAMYKKKFKPEMFLTQMNIFFIIGETTNITIDSIKDFSDHSLGYSIKNNRGLMRGMQSGVMSISVLMSNNVDGGAIEWVQERPPKHYAAMEVPVIYDLSNNNYYFYKDTPLWGMIYYPYIIALINNALRDQ